MPLTPQQQYQLRLKNEYEAIRLLPRNDIYTIVPTAGQRTPYVTSYDVTFNIPTIVNGNGRRQERTSVRVILPENFPVSEPHAFVIAGSIPFHVNWYTAGGLCNGNFWNPSRWLWEYINFIGEVLQFKPSRINVNSPANRDAIPYYTSHKSSFPTDHRNMPVPRKGIRIL